MRHALPLPALILMAACLSLPSSCHRRDASVNTDGASIPGSAASSHPVFTRIVCGSPAVTELVFALGVGDAVVGVSDFTTAPAEARRKERIGGLFNPNRERLTALKPDIIITQGRHEALAAFAREGGIRFHTVQLEALSDIPDAISSIATVLGIPESGTALSVRIKDDLDAIRRQTASLPRRSVLLVVGRTPGSLSSVTTAGPGSFLDGVVDAAGGQNAFGDAWGPYPQVSKESVLARRPEVIIEIASVDVPDHAFRLLRDDWRQLAEIPAVRHDRVFCLAEDFLLVPGPRVAMAARALAEVIHGADLSRDEAAEP